METPGELVGRHVLRDFGKHGVHKGTITSFDDDGDLTFRVEYPDGDFEDLAEDDVRVNLFQKRIIKVTSRSRRVVDTDDAESDYIIEETDNSDQSDLPVSTSQATTQPFECNVASQEASQPIPVNATSAPAVNVRRRALPSVRERSTSTLWVASPCPSTISVHYNAIDRGLCGQTLREHHTVLERAMVRLYPRFKWGRSHYLQVQHCCNIEPYILISYL